MSLPVDGRKLIINAINEGTTDSARILSHFRNLGGKSYFINLLEEAGEADSEDNRAHGHKKGDNKTFQSIKATPRTIYNKMTYKMLDLDAMEVYENPELVSIRAEELVNNILAEWARAAIIGDGRTAPASGQPDYRMFDGARGFYSVLADATAQSGIGTNLASSTSVAGNLYDGVVAGRGYIKTEGGQILIAKSAKITALLQAKANNGYLVAPGARIEDILGVERVYTPTWMDSQTVDAILLVNNAYKHGGERGIRARTEFDTSNNTDILLDETPRFGSLGEYKSAVAITLSES